MKTIKFSLLLFLATASMTFSSCSKDDAKDETVQSATFIKFSIDGSDYDFKDIISAQSDISMTLNGNNGEGITNAGDIQITVYFPAEPVKGTFDFEGTFGVDHKLSFSSESLGFDFDFAESGSVTITEITDDYISGTFTATITAEDETTITVTNGAFKGEMF